MASFSVRFLGCKVSHVDAHEVRERLLADGHSERDDGAEVAIVNTCCVTHEALAKSRKEAARAARTHARVYVTGCGANLAAEAFSGLPSNVFVVAKRSEETPAFVAGDVGAIGCVQADTRDDGVLRDMGRRYTVATYLRRLAPLQEEFNLTSDVIVGFPTEDERAFANTLRTAHRAGLTKMHVFPYSPRPGTVTAQDDPVPPRVKKERSARLRAASHEACLARWRTKVGSEDVVLVDRPGRGYGDDYSPWLVDAGAPLGELVRVRGASVLEEGILAA